MANLEPRPLKDGLWEVRLTGTGGSVPNELSGKWTHKDRAELAIEMYQRELQSKLKSQRKGIS